MKHTKFTVIEGGLSHGESRRCRFGEVPLKLLVSPGGAVSASAKPGEKLAVVHDQRSKMGLRDLPVSAVPAGVVQELFPKRHDRSDVFDALEYKGNSPVSSTGYYPDAWGSLIRDNPRMERESRKALLERIDLRLAELGISPHAASKAGGLNPDYIRDLKREEVGSPTLDKLAKLAKGLQCDVAWLATGQPSLSNHPYVSEALSILSSISEERLHRAVEHLRDAERADVAEREERQRSKKRPGKASAAE